LTSECLPFSAIPHTTRLFADYLHSFEKVAQFYSRPPLEHGWVSDQSRALAYDPARRRAVAGILKRQNRAWSASPETLENIARFRQGAFAVVTGQQVSLFGGPLFSLYKALTAIKLAAEFSRAGTECVPVFWLATEDHDLEEVNHATLLGPEGTLHRLVSSARGAENAPVSSVILGEDAQALTASAAEVLGAGEVAEWLRQGYRPGETLGSAFARLFSHIFSHSGVVLLDASDPELHGLAAPLYRDALSRAAELEQALLLRNRELESAGYHAQARVTPSSTLLFHTENGSRQAIHRSGADFVVGARKIPAAELQQQLSSDPGGFSANVLLRPVVEDYLLPTLAYVGGPSEVAYFAQAAVVYEKLLGRVTPILPRFSATLVEPRTRRLLERYRVSVADTFHGVEHLQELLAEHAMSKEVHDAFDSAEKAVESSLASLRQSLENFDPTLAEASARSESKMRYQLGRLRSRVAHAELQRQEDIGRHAEQLIACLFPNKNLQEREVAGISLVARYGPQLLLQLYDAVQTACPDHQVLHL
jgi:bacillithiol biosynthesis cysteine-adding enzyme BshC